MSRREKILAIVVAAIGIGAVGQFFFKKFITSIDQKDGVAIGLRGEIERLEIEWARLKRDKRQLDQYYKQSLPANRVSAKSQYEAWLLHLASDVSGFEGVQMPVSGPRPVRGIYDLYSFKITATADRKKLTKFLHKFYEVDFLHLIRDLNVAPKEGKLSIVMNVDVVGIRKANKDFELEERPSNRLTYGDLKQYEEKVVEMNLFGPPNQPPTIANRTRQLEPGKEQWMSVSVGAGERDQNVDLEIVSHDFPKDDAPTIKDGRIRVFGKKEGSHKVTLRATDDGLPRKSVTQELVVVFKNPPPPRVPEKPAEFDESIVAFYTAFIETDNVPSAWISVRTSDRRVVVQVGKEFKIGSITGMVKKITPELIEYESEGSLWTLRAGDNLQQARKMAAVASKVSSTGGQPASTAEQK